MNEMEWSQFEAAMDDAREQAAQACVKLGEIVRATAIIVAPALAQMGRDLNAALDIERRTLAFRALGVDATQARELAELGYDPAALAALRDFVQSLAAPPMAEPAPAPAPPRNDNPRRKPWESPRWQPKGRR